MHAKSHRRKVYRPRLESLESRIALSFLPPVDYRVDGRLPFISAISDLDADGHLDLAVTNRVGNNATVLLNNGDGTFRRGVLLPLGGESVGIVAADFDLDGTTDLAVAARGRQAMAFFPGNGDGTFGERIDLDGVPTPQWVVSADFNLDGVPDLAVSNFLESRLTLLLGNGDFTFVEGHLAVDGGPNQITAGDFNQDGYPDLAATSQHDHTGAQVLLNNGDGSFADAVRYEVPGLQHPGITTADFDGDGILDLAVTIPQHGVLASVAVLLGAGDGTFGPPQLTVAGGNYWFINSADFNQDGLADVVMGQLAADFAFTVSVLLGNGDGTFGVRLSYSQSLNPYGAFVGDFNSDGYPDFVTNRQGATVASVSVYLNDGVWGEPAPGDGGNGPTGLGWFHYDESLGEPAFVSRPRADSPPANRPEETATVIDFGGAPAGAWATPFDGTQQHSRVRLTSVAESFLADWFTEILSSTD